MTATVNHTIVASRDAAASAAFYRDLPEAAEAPSWGPFVDSTPDGGVLLQFAALPEDAHPRRHDLPLRRRRAGRGPRAGPAGRRGSRRPPGGGAQSILAFLDADLVDTLHVAVAPVRLGSGTRLRTSPERLDDRFHRDEVPSPRSGVVHHLLWRR